MILTISLGCPRWLLSNTLHVVFYIEPTKIDHLRQVEKIKKKGGKKNGASFFFLEVRKKKNL